MMNTNMNSMASTFHNTYGPPEVAAQPTHFSGNYFGSIGSIHKQMLTGEVSVGFNSTSQRFSLMDKLKK